jgi:3-deoxy-D-manno-octulosonic acid kinase
VKTNTHKQDSLAIVYAAEVIQHPDPNLFDARYWSEQGAITGEGVGRGRALFLETGFGPAVLRQYLRGGWAARVSRDRYLFSGFGRSRPMAEFGLLENLFANGLPVPEPLAAMCIRQGAFYKGWLLMREIQNVGVLADLIPTQQGNAGFWHAIGACVRRFHDFGLAHADLNTRNILVGGDDDVYLIDFDRASLRRKNSRAFSRNLRRLHRSLQKVWPKPDRRRLEPCWLKLLEGYDNEAVSP